MTGQMIDPQDSGLAAEWLLIMERLKVDDLAAWIAQYRRGDRTSNPQWRSWEGVARLILEQTRVTVSTGGLRVRWSDAVDEILRQQKKNVIRTREEAEQAGLGESWDAVTRGQQPDVPTREQTVGSTGPAGTLGSEVPAGSNRGEATP